MQRGRPTGSQVRQNIIEILHYGTKLHGYKIATIYKELFPKITMRTIYYHLKRGIATGELKITETKKEQGNYSWGGEVYRKYYELGPNAKPSEVPLVKEYFEQKKTSQNQTPPTTTHNKAPNEKPTTP